MILESDIKEAFERYLITSWYPEKWVIIYKGSEIRLNSGKQVWATAAAAKSSLTHHINHTMSWLLKLEDRRNKRLYDEAKTKMCEWCKNNLEIVRRA